MQFINKYLCMFCLILIHIFLKILCMVYVFLLLWFKYLCMVFCFSFSYGGGSFSFSKLILGITESFNTDVELQQVLINYCSEMIDKTI